MNTDQIYWHDHVSHLQHKNELRSLDTIKFQKRTRQPDSI